METPTPSHLGGHHGITHVDEGTLKFLMRCINARNFLDIGCGPGGQIKVARGLGLEAYGIDGDPSLGAVDGVSIHDFSKGPPTCCKLAAGEVYDIGWSVEFLEHIYPGSLANAMKAFQRCRLVFITHALPGQFGHHHVNLQPTGWWKGAFAEYGLQFMPGCTREVRRQSTMEREFCRQSGKVFWNKALENPMARVIRHDSVK